MTARDAALTYASRGWRVHPIPPGHKYPAGYDRWQDNATTDPQLIAQWYDQHPGHGVCIATGEASGVFVLDVDCAAGKVGFDSFTALEDQHGPLPPTVEAITGTGGRHLYYRHPAGLELNNSAGRLGPDLDIRANGGQVVAAPTLHPDTGQAYAWDLEHHPDDTPIADAPPWLLALLQPPPKVDAGPRGDTDTATLAWDRYNYTGDAADNVAFMLTADGWTEGRPGRDGVRYFTRPGKAGGISASLGKVAPGVLFCFTGSASPLEAERSYDPSDVLTLLHFGGDRAAADRWLVEGGWGIASHSITAGDVTDWIADNQTPGQEATAAVLAGRWLPETFWAARPILRHIRQASHNRLVAADAVLGAVLARVAVMCPHYVELPAIVGSPMGLTFYVAIVGNPEEGKSSAAGLAAELLPASDSERILDPLAIGSGEGFVEVMFDMRPDPDDEKGKRLIKQQTKYGAIFHIDEGTLLGDLGQRSGSTIMPTLRTAFTHGTLGAANATAEKKRHLQGHLYVYGVTMGIQPEMAGDLLSEVAAGTPQRFVWLMASDPSISDDEVPWPGPLPWAPPTWAIEMNDRGWGRSQINVPPEVRLEVRRARLAVMRREGERDPSDAHRMLVRLKVAALFGLLDGRCGIDAQDWALAGTVVTTSRNVRRSVEMVLGTAATQKEKAITDRHVRRELTIEDSREHRALTSASKSVGRAVVRHGEAQRHGEGPCKRNCITTAIASAHRKLVDVDDVIAEAVAHDWIIAAGDGWGPGSSRPA